MIANDMKTVDVDMNLLRTELARLPHVTGVTATMTQPFSLNGNSYGSVLLNNEAGALSRPVVNLYVDHDFASTLGIRLLAGRAFERARGADERAAEGSTLAVIVDATLATQLGALTPDDAVGKIVYLPTSSDGKTPPQPASIVGVVANKPLTLMGVGSTATI
jgi:hypothetical protein